ncbi:hypothetical protein MGU_08964 [Metarhizium guizhouense ARSEF 977]|uniref:PD-(D/E)XK nuclease-like domain-containing protein n=1 Tax=Metarhizium guizhouense (strain ARSEF 977) TaxID=1276136 RepID=A0A0B4GMG2_METGA|nr:hypothetical protein MGU_08964 [Metarhizium guizhouense ARSEF 977]
MHCRADIVAAWSKEVPLGRLSDPFIASSHSNRRPPSTGTRRVKNPVVIRCPVGDADVNRASMRKTRSKTQRVAPRTPPPEPSNEDDDPATITRLPSRPRLYAKALSAASDHRDDIFVDPDAETTSTSSATSSKRSKSPVKRVADLRRLGVYFDTLSPTAEALGPEGQILFYDLSDMASGLGTIPKSLWDDSPDFRNELGRKPHSSHFTDIDDLYQDFATIKKVVMGSRRCDKDLEPECEWNHAVHAKLLAHVFDKEDGAVGFRSTMSDRIDSQWLPKHPSGLSSSRMFDFCCYVRGDDTRLADTRRFWDPSVNSFNRLGLNWKLAPFLIETKTISRTEAEARDQLGTCIWAQIERLKSMARSSPAAQAVLRQMIFPLAYANGSRWTLMFARIDSTDYSKIVGSPLPTKCLPELTMWPGHSFDSLTKRHVEHGHGMPYSVYAEKT